MTTPADVRRDAERHARRIAESDQYTRRDYRPGTGPVRGLVIGLAMVSPIWAGVIAVGWWLW